MGNLEVYDQFRELAVLWLLGCSMPILNEFGLEVLWVDNKALFVLPTHKRDMCVPAHTTCIFMRDKTWYPQIEAAMRSAEEVSVQHIECVS